MRLGTRWAFGAATPAAVPTELTAAIPRAEAAVGESGSGMSWTLTWLEGRPIATLDDDTVVTIEEGEAIVRGARDPEPDDDW